MDYSQKILTRIRQDINYSDVNKLTHETLWYTGHWRLDLLQFILIHYFHTISPNVYFPSTLIDQLVHSQNNDEREQLLVKCFSYLGLMRMNDRSIVSGTCDLQVNYKFMNQILDLAKMNASSLNDTPGNTTNVTQNMVQTLERDSQFLNVIAHNQSTIFDVPFRLFSQDILSRLPDEPVYVYFVYLVWNCDTNRID
jgi:hypothetical protein